MTAQSKASVAGAAGNETQRFLSTTDSTKQKKMGRRRSAEQNEGAWLAFPREKSYFLSSLSFSVPYLLLIGKKEVKNIKMLWKTFIRVLGNCLHQRWQFAAWLISFERLFWFCSSHRLDITLQTDQDKVAQSSTVNKVPLAVSNLQPGWGLCSSSEAWKGIMLVACIWDCSRSRIF